MEMNHFQYVPASFHFSINLFMGLLDFDLHFLIFNESLLHGILQFELYTFVVLSILFLHDNILY
jgi:hypothetical protein